jgi:tripartite-type tricarboxylate transporter receptor subunit TctC
MLTSKRAILQFASFVAAAIMLGIGGPAAAQNAAADYPSRPIQIIVPFSAGGVSDVLVRAVAKKLSDDMGQPVVINNLPGANTQIAAMAGAKADPDGYTLLMASDPAMSINPWLYKQLRYNPEEDFVPITPLVTFSQILVTTPSVPAKTLKEFVAYAKSNPGKLNYGSFGVGSQPHLLTEEFNRLTGIKAVHIPYKGVAPAVVDMLQGQIQYMLASVATPLGHLRAGKLVAIAIAGPHRSDLLPEVPTFAEAGFGEFESSGWFGMFAPKGTPKGIVDKLATRITAIVRSPEFKKEHLQANGLDAAGGTPEEFATFLRDDRAKWKKIVENSGVKLE